MVALEIVLDLVIHIQFTLKKSWNGVDQAAKKDDSNVDFCFFQGAKRFSLFWQTNIEKPLKSQQDCQIDTQVVGYMGYWGGKHFRVICFSF